LLDPTLSEIGGRQTRVCGHASGKKGIEIIMNKVKTLRLVLLATFVCFIQAALPIGAAQAGWQQSQRPDGSNIDWHLDLPDADGRHGLVVIAQGSGCQPVEQNHNIVSVRQAFAGFAALTVEKYGIAPDAKIEDSFQTCPDGYHAHNTASQRVADYAQIVGELKNAPWWDGRLVLFGGSMGGSVMARLAPLVDADAAILLSTGGGTSFGEMVLQTVPEEARPMIEQQFDEIRKQPESTEVWSGYSFRFWADALDRREIDEMLKTDAALLLIQGGRDTSSPVGVARAAVDRFIEAERNNLTYWEYSGYDHGMVDTEGLSHMHEVLDLAANWLAQVLSQ
jgi:alpha-beta hydrolase superfamily lysophospholipase